MKKSNRNTEKSLHRSFFKKIIDDLKMQKTKDFLDGRVKNICFDMADYSITSFYCTFAPIKKI